VYTYNALLLSLKKLVEKEQLSKAELLIKVSRPAQAMLLIALDGHGACV
jgi:hypothetical protein